MVPTLILLLASATSAAPPDVGAITCVIDDVTVLRDGELYRARQGSGVRPGDHFATPTEGGAGLHLKKNLVVYLGGDTMLSVESREGGLQLRLDGGEARLTARDVGLLVEVGAWQIKLTRGIVRVAVDRYQARLWVESGSVQVLEDVNAVRDVRAGEELVRPTAGAALLTSAGGKGWSIRAADYRLAAATTAADGECRRRESCVAEGDDSCVREDGDEVATDRPRPSTRPQQQQAANSRFTPGAFGNTVGSGANAFSLASSAANFSDANQQTQQGQLTRALEGLSIGDPFPGNIHLVTGQTRYQFDSVQFNAAERAAIYGGGQPAYWSIGVGASPVSQVTTDFNTASGASPQTVRIPGYNAYLVRLEQYTFLDSTLNPQAGLASNVGYAGLVGATPVAPTINGATPLPENRVQFNDEATFAIGEFRLMPTNGAGDNLQLAIRQSDQDRLIVKDPGNNDALDQVTPNPDITDFVDVADPRFLPAVPLVKVPGPDSYAPQPTYSSLDRLRRAAATTLMADQLHDYAQRTGQTRFVITEPVTGAQRIIDITGYQR